MSRGSSRRSFLHVGFCGGIGLTLSQYFKLQFAQADIKNYKTKEDRKVGYLYFSSGRNGASGKFRPQAVCSD